MHPTWYCKTSRMPLTSVGPKHDLFADGLATLVYLRPAINGPISCGSWMINCMCASVYEAEMAGGFQAAQEAVHHRRILADLGYPQPATLLRMDNTVALGIASGKMNAKSQKGQVNGHEVLLVG